MADWLDGWERRPRSDSGPMLRGAGRCLLFHTMEGSFDGGVSTLDRNNNWPHLAYDPASRRKIQAIPFSRAAKSLANKAGGVETNRWGVIQVELSGRAAETQDWPDEWLRNIAVDVVGPVQAAVGNRLHFPQFFGTDAGFTIATASAPQRMSFADWLAFDGICGHQHAPENDHWDPGKLDVARIVAHVGGQTQKGSDMHIGLVPHTSGPLAYLVDGGFMLDQLPSEPRGGYAIPQKALDLAAEHGWYIHSYSVESWARVAGREPGGWFTRLFAYLTKLFPRKAERAGTP